MPANPRTNPPVPEKHEGFSDPDGIAPPWSDIEAQLERADLFWISTTRADGRPHVTPLPAVWLDGALHFSTGAEEQKFRNLERNPRCILTTGTASQHEGTDVVVEGTAAVVDDPARLRELASLYESRLGWHYQVDGTELVQDGHRATVFGVAPDKVLAFVKEPYAQVRYRFPR
jgi:nitroimidazol reductase NimA-like FMN-containing flavoprotein (pyridoxamine 5'-phosphate oxidase superfamily)